MLGGRGLAAHEPEIDVHLFAAWLEEFRACVGPVGNGLRGARSFSFPAGELNFIFSPGKPDGDRPRMDFKSSDAVLTAWLKTELGVRALRLAPAGQLQSIDFVFIILVQKDSQNSFWRKLGKVADDDPLVVSPPKRL